MVPANDDAGRAIALYCDLVARAAIDGISRGQGALGVDLGESEEPMAEELPALANEPEVAPVDVTEPYVGEPSSCWPPRAAPRTT